MKIIRQPISLANLDDSACASFGFCCDGSCCEAIGSCCQGCINVANI